MDTTDIIVAIVSNAFVGRINISIPENFINTKQIVYDVEIAEGHENAIDAFDNIGRILTTIAQLETERAIIHKQTFKES